MLDMRSDVNSILISTISMPGFCANLLVNDGKKQKHKKPEDDYNIFFKRHHLRFVMRFGLCL